MTKKEFINAVRDYPDDAEIRFFTQEDEEWIVLSDEARVLDGKGENYISIVIEELSEHMQ